MAYFLSPIGNAQHVSTSGAPLNAGTITTFVAGTSTPQATYVDNAGSAPSVSLTLNTYGLPSSPVWLKGGLTYKFVVKDSLGNTVRTVDNVQGIDDPAAFGITYPSDGTFSFRNRLHNGNFIVNQRAVAGTVTLAAGAYGHDRWKAGAAGCTYTFATVGNSTVITITAGSLQQVVEATNVEGGVYTLVNQGTAQARYAVSGGTTSGGYFAATAAAPLALSTATANQTITVEFTTGTVDRVQLEPGTAATPFERRPSSVERGLCLWYAQLITGSFSGLANGTTTGEFNVPYLSPMRAVPTMTNIANGTWVNGAGAAAVTGATLSTAFANGAARCSFTTAGGLGVSQPVTIVGQSVLLSADL
jgi:hypothetical protein